ncbi:radical SAM protein [bacterium]|nr:radical SAM protein [bacterium]
MRILMLNPPYFKKFSRSQRSPAVTKSGCIYYPMWLAYATGVLEQAGYDVKLVDAPGDGYNLEYILSLAEEFQPELTVIDTSTPSINNDVQVAEAIKDKLDTFICLVGTHVSALPEESLLLSDSINAVAVREYDYTILELARRIEHGKKDGLEKRRNDNHKGAISKDIKNPVGNADLSGVKGLSYRQNGKIFHNEKRPLIDNLDGIPFVSEVYKRHLKIENYFYGGNLHPVVTIVSGRGCPNRCIYCLYPQTMTGHKYRYRSIKKVVDELEYIKDQFPQMREVFLEDDTLTVNKDRCLEFSDEILSRGLKITWSTNSRADADFETLKAIKKAGCRYLCVGFESAEQSILDNMMKNLKVEQVYEFVINAKKAGLLVHGCFLVGNPGETKETLEKTLAMAKELDPDSAQFFPIMVYPGTKAYEWAFENRYLTTNDYREWLTKDGLHNCVVSRPGLTERELVEFCDHARASFYFRPKYIIRKAVQSLLDFKEAKRNIKAGLTSFKYLVRGSFPD